MKINKVMFSCFIINFGIGISNIVIGIETKSVFGLILGHFLIVFSGIMGGLSIENE